VIARRANCQAFFYVSLFGLVVLASCNRAEQPTRVPLAAAAPAAELGSVEPPATTVDSTSLPDEVKQIVDQLATDFPAWEIDFARGQIFVSLGRATLQSVVGARLESDPQFALARGQFAYWSASANLNGPWASARGVQAGPSCRRRCGSLVSSQFEDAIEPLQQQTRLQPKIRKLVSSRRAYLEMEQPEQAKQAFQSAIDAFADCAPTVWDRTGS
jgi:hypothetical protein